MGFLIEGLDRKLLTNQRDVVRNERRQGEGRPYAAAEEAVAHLLYPKDHPYYGDVIGSHADIEAARIADIRDFHQQFYTPNNASIAIAGDFDPVKLKELLTKYFGPIPSGPKVDPVTVVTPPITSQRRADGDRYSEAAAVDDCVADAAGLYARRVRHRSSDVCAGWGEGQPVGPGVGL